MPVNCQSKLAGLLIPVFALRRENDLGIGDTQAVKQAIDLCAKNHIAVLQLLPINETGGDNSPYNAISATALDPALLTVASDTIPWLSQSAAERIIQPKLKDTANDATINYPLVKQLKLDLLRDAFANFIKTKGVSTEEEWQHFESFKKRNQDWLKNYVLFRALVEEQAGDTCWTEWPNKFRNPVSANDWLLRSAQSEKFIESCQFWSFVQWLADQQWQQVKVYAEKNNVALMGDIPFGVSRLSADVWANQNLFDLDWCGGAPPEGFFQGDDFTRQWGQNWGIPIYNWHAHKLDNFRWWRERIHQTARYCHYFRIDHVLGFFRIYSFPWLPEKNEQFIGLDKDAVKTKTGGRLPKFIPRDDDTSQSAQLNLEEGTELLKVILEAAGSTGVVAEDLGAVPTYVRPTLEKLGIPGFAIPIFERMEDGDYRPKELLKPLSLCTYATHDHEPLASLWRRLSNWWHGPDGDQGWLEVKRLMKFLSLADQEPPSQFTETLQFAFFRALLESPCWLAVFMITDLLGTEQRFNEPGLSGEYNWSQRLDQPILSYENDSRYANKIMYLRDAIRESGRLPNVPAQIVT